MKEPVNLIAQPKSFDTFAFWKLQICLQTLATETVHAHYVFCMTKIVKIQEL